MIQSFQLHVETHGGVCDLGRVVGVLALWDLTPQALTACGGPSGMTIEMSLQGDNRSCELCASRLGALAAVTYVTLQPKVDGAS